LPNLKEAFTKNVNEDRVGAELPRLVTLVRDLQRYRANRRSASLLAQRVREVPDVSRTGPLARPFDVGMQKSAWPTSMQSPVCIAGRRAIDCI
jgi:hypothetical protein